MRKYNPKRKSRSSKPSEKESVIQRRILDWLAYKGIFHWRQNSGFAHVFRRRIQLGPTGAPDIMVVLPPTGHLVGLEVKTAKGRQRDTQKLFQSELEAAGGEYHIVRSLEDAKGAIGNGQRPN